MPFVEIDWSRYKSGVAGKRAEEILAEIARPGRLLLLSVGCHLQYTLSPTNSFYTKLSSCHRLTVCLLLILILLALVSSSTLLPFNNHFALTSARIFALFAFYLQTVASSILVVSLQLTKFAVNFQRLLDSATTGVGVQKFSAGMRRVYRAVLSASCAVALFWIGYHCTAYFTVYLPSQPLDIKQQQHQPVAVLSLDGLRFVLLSLSILFWALSMSEICLYLSAIAAEFQAMTNDMRGDDNLYQTPVIRHYILVRDKLRKLLRLFSVYCGWFMLTSFILPLSVLFLIVIGAGRTHNIDWTDFSVIIDLSICLSLAVTFIYQLVLITGFGLFVKYQVNHISETMGALIASDRNMQEQYRHMLP